MKNHINFIGTLILSVVVSTGCALFKKEEPKPQNVVSQEDLELRKKFEDGIKLLDQQRYAESLEIFNEMLNNKLPNEFYLVTLYNSGSAYEGLGECKKAGIRYLRTAKFAMGKFKKIEAQALYRLSHAYECLGLNNKLIASLNDASSRSKFLPKEVALAELPARFAAAYARIGNRKEAEKYFAVAQNGIKEVKFLGKSNAQKIEIMSRTLYFMGRVQQTKRSIMKKPDPYIDSIRFLQGYLLKAVELNNRNWSKKAAQNLLEAYQNVWMVMQGLPAPEDNDIEVARRQKKEKIVELATKALANLNALKLMRFPDDREPPLVTQVFNRLGEHEKRIVAYLSRQGVRNVLTPEEKIRSGIKRKGVTRGGKTVLEKNQ